MNQILYDNERQQTTDIKKIILFFCIAIIVFGVTLAGEGVYGMFAGQKAKAPVSTEKPDIFVEPFGEDAIRVSVTHDKPIDRILYCWNNGDDEIIWGRGRDEIVQLIDLPEGENVFSLRVIDEIGIEASYTNTYLYSSTGVDVAIPEIKLTALEEEKKIVITATDETEISYITYRWNNEEEIRIDRTEEDKTTIEVAVDIPKGDNSLTVIAVDANNNTETKIQRCQAYTRPTIQMPHQYGKKLTITVTDEEGLDYVEYTLNGKTYRWTSTTEDRKEWTHVQELEPGENIIIIEAYNKAGLQANTFKGRCTYTP